MKLFKKERIGETMWGIGAGIGGLVTIRRLEKAIRPNSRFVIAEVGIMFLEAVVFFGCFDLGAKYGKAIDAGLENAKKKEESENEIVKNFAEWKAKVEKEEEEMAETFSQWINPKKEIENGNE